MEKEQRNDIIATGVKAAVVGGIGAAIGYAKHKANKTHDTNEAIRKQQGLDNQKLAYQKSKARQDLGIEEERHKQKLRHMQEEHDLKQRLNSQASPTAAEEEEPALHQLLVSDDTPDVLSADDYDDVEDGGVAQVMGDWIHEGDVVLVFAPTGVGKSIFSMQLAMDLVEGTPSKAFPVADPPKQQYVLYIDFEMMPKEQKQRYGMRMKQLKEQSLGEQMVTWHYYGKKVAKERFFNLIAEHVQTVEERNITIVIDNLDKLIALWGASAPGEVIDTMFVLTANAARMLDKNVTVVVVGHTRKRKGNKSGIDDDDLFGSSHQRNAGKVIIAVDPSDEGKGYYWLRLLKNRNGKKHSVKAKRITDEEPGNFHFEYIEEITLHAEEEDKPDSASPAVGGADTRAFLAVEPAIRTEVQPGQSSVNYSSFPRHERLTWGNDALRVNHLAEKTAIWEIVREERAKGVGGREVINRIEAFFNVTLNLTNVSQITKDGGDNSVKRPISLNDSGDSDFDRENKEAEKIKKLYFAKYQ